MSDSKRATEDLLDELHGLVADTFVDEIRRLAKTEAGVPASLLAQAAKFLKDNSIDAPGRKNDKVDRLAGQLSDLDFEDPDTTAGLPN